MSGAVTAAVVGGGAYLAGAGAVAPLVAATIGIGAGTMVAQDRNAKKDRADQQVANAQMQAAAEKQAGQAQEAFAAANRKRADIGGIAAANRQGAGGGAASTMLTGAYGVGRDQLALSTPTLLGA